MVTNNITILIIFFFTILFSLIFLVGLLASIAFMTLLERKFIAITQNRKGPNFVGIFGLLQPIADALKLFLKETIIPKNSKKYIFIISPIISLFFVLLAWSVLPFDYFTVFSNINLAILVIFVLSILHVYGIFLAGWSSRSRYSFLGAMRSSAQLIAYDINVGLIVLIVVFVYNKTNLIEVVEVQENFSMFYLLPFFFLFFICSLAETNRHPFDLPEAEAELVAGYATEYTALKFAFFFLAEYCSILMMSFFMVILFLKGWLPIFSFITFSPEIWLFLKVIIIYYFFLMVRATIPRYRYDQLMYIGWLFIMPLCFALLIMIIIIKLCVNLNFSSEILLNTYVNFKALNFTNPATDIMLGIIRLHNIVMAYILFIFFFTMTFLYYSFKSSVFFFKENVDESFLKNSLVEYVKNPGNVYLKHSPKLEFIWVILPALLLIIIAYPSLLLLYYIDSPAQPIFTVSVIGSQWFWTYEYSDFSLVEIFKGLIYKDKDMRVLQNWFNNILELFSEGGFNTAKYFKGAKLSFFLENRRIFNKIPEKLTFDSNLLVAKGLEFPRLLTTDQALVIPSNVPIRFLVTSTDVVHSWAIPSFGVKIDAIPGRINQVVVEVKINGTFWGQCSELCGVNHGFMPIEVRVLSLPEFLFYVNIKAREVLTPLLSEFIDIRRNFFKDVFLIMLKYKNAVSDKDLREWQNFIEYLNNSNNYLTLMKNKKIDAQ